MTSPPDVNVTVTIPGRVTARVAAALHARFDAQFPGLGDGALFKKVVGAYVQSFTRDYEITNAANAQAATSDTDLGGIG